MNRGGQAEWCPKCEARVMPVGTLGAGANARDQKWQCPIHYVETVERDGLVSAEVWLGVYEAREMRRAWRR